jgi:predicted nuclease of predicted toxin-antitoxin system
MTRILLDQGLSPAAAALLREAGWDALHVSDVAMARADDLEILEYCQAENNAHLALLRSNGPSVVLLRAEGMNAPEQAALVRAVWALCEAELETGAAVSAGRRSIRIRPLPLR